MSIKYEVPHYEISFLRSKHSPYYFLLKHTLFSYLREKDQAWHPYKITCKFNLGHQKLEWTSWTDGLTTWSIKMQDYKWQTGTCVKTHSHFLSVPPHITWANQNHTLWTDIKCSFWKLMVAEPKTYRYTVKITCYADRDRISRVTPTQI